MTVTWNDWSNDTASKNNIEIDSDSFQLATAIPDSGLLHQYDWSADSTTTSSVTDQAGNADLSGNFTSFSDINGVQAGTFDGTDDTMSAAFSTFDPVDVFAVARFEQNVDQIFVDGESVYTHSVWHRSGDWHIFAGNNVDSNVAADTNSHIFGARFGSTDELRLDGSEIFSGDAGANQPDGVTVGDRYDGSAQTANATIGELLYYDPSASGYSRADVETYLSDKWGITL
jgi:hypothetical protein